MSLSLGTLIDKDAPFFLSYKSDFISTGEDFQSRAKDLEEVVVRIKKLRPEEKGGRRQEDGRENLCSNS